MFIEEQVVTEETSGLSPIQSELIETVQDIRSALELSSPEYIADEIIHPRLSLADKGNSRIRISNEDHEIELILGTDSAVFFVFSDNKYEVDYGKNHTYTHYGYGLMIGSNNINQCNLLNRDDVHLDHPNVFTFVSIDSTDDQIDNICQYILLLLNDKDSEISFRVK